jgi:hypothetical protein
MKLIAPLAYLSAAYADLISYRLQNSASEMAAIFISDASFAASLFNHGCWCAKLTNQASNNLGGNQPVDELDQICKDWARARRCSRATGSSCEFADFTSTYEIETSSQRCIDSDTCLSETCQIDYHFISEINSWRSANPGAFSAVESPVCPAHTTAQLNNCQDFSTTALPTTTAATTTPAGLAEVYDALDSAGVDNSVKEIAVTLVWDVYCDLDLHVYEPDGTEIAYYNRGPTANTGTLDVDASTPGANGLVVENISWVTAPSGTYRVAVKNYGYCSPGPSYKLYIKIDGSTQVYERQAPSGDNTKIEVASFSWSANARSRSNEVNTYELAINDDNAPQKE